MFGGLDLKGSVAGGRSDSKNGTQDKTPAPAAPAPAVPAPAAAAAAPAAATSAFSFLNSSIAAAPADAPAPASSGFGFLNAAPATSRTQNNVDSAESSNHEPAEPVAVSAQPPVPPASGFAFMASTSVVSELTAPPADEASAPVSETAAAAPPSSAFSFLNSANANANSNANGVASPPTEHAESQQQQQQQSSETNGATPAATSGFSFMATGAPPNATASSSNAPNMPAGAGITFTAVSGPPAGVKKKKKSRANRIGVASSTAPPAAPVTTPQPPAAEPSRASTADAASDAARRAEEFMQQKAIESTRSQSATPVSAASTSATSTLPPPDIPPTASTDEVVAAAERAAEKAKAQMARKSSVGSSSSNRFMGGIFKSFGGSGSNNNNNTNNINTNIATLNTSDKAPFTRPSSSSSSADPMAKQNNDMKRAAAERELKMTQQTQPPTSSLNQPSRIASPPAIAIEPPSASVPAPTATSSGWEPPTLENKPLAPLSSFGIPAQSTDKATASASTVPPPSTVGSLLLPSSTIIPAATPPPASKSVGVQKLEQLQWKFALQVQQAWQAVQNTKSQQVMLQQERFVAMAKYQLCQQQIQQAEKQLQVAAEQEDYELAGQLSEVVEKHQAEQSEIKALLRSTERALEQVQSQISVVTQNVSICFDTLSSDLKKLKQEEQDSTKADSSQGGSTASNLAATLEKFAEVSKMLSAEEERLAQDFKHLERDQKLAQEERDELEKTILEHSGEYERQKEDCEKELEETEEKIAELRKQLDEAQKKASQLRTAKYGFEDQIVKVRVKFSRQLTRVEKKERTVAENRSEWELESSSLKRQKDAHEVQVDAHSKALVEQEELLQTIEYEQKRCVEFIDLWNKTQSDDDVDNGKKDDGKDDLAELQANVVKCEAAVNEATVVMRTADQTIANLESEHAMLLQKIPQLEAEKKAAAKRRDFKAAGKASKEMNDAIARSQVVSGELAGSASARQAEAKAELERCQQEFDAAKEVALEQESVQGKQQMRKLAMQIASIRETKQKLLSSSSSSSRTSKVEEADDGASDHPGAKQNSVEQVGAKILDGQIEVLLEEGSALGDKYGGWDELLAELAPVDTTDVSTEKLEVDETISLTGDGASKQSPAVTDDAKVGAEEAEASDGHTAAASNADVTSNTEKLAELSSAEKIAKVRELLQRVKKAEEDLEAASEREDYDLAAELHDVFIALQSELEGMQLTDEETELAMSDEPIPEAVTSAAVKSSDAAVEDGQGDASVAAADEDDTDTNDVPDSPSHDANGSTDVPTDPAGENDDSSESHVEKERTEDGADSTTKNEETSDKGSGDSPSDGDNGVNEPTTDENEK